MDATPTNHDDLLQIKMRIDSNLQALAQLQKTQAKILSLLEATRRRGKQQQQVVALKNHSEDVLLDPQQRRTLMEGANNNESTVSLCSTMNESTVSLVCSNVPSNNLPSVMSYSATNNAQYSLDPTISNQQQYPNALQENPQQHDVLASLIDTRKEYNTRYTMISHITNNLLQNILKDQQILMLRSRVRSNMFSSSSFLNTDTSTAVGSNNSGTHHSAKIDHYSSTSETIPRIYRDSTSSSIQGNEVHVPLSQIKTQRKRRRTLKIEEGESPSSKRSSRNVRTSAFNDTTIQTNRRETQHDEIKDKDHKKLTVQKDRKWLPLGINQDVSRLSTFLCFLRSECIEVFIATEDFVIERLISKRVQVGQVGIRCRFCAHLSRDKRVGRSANFPSSISNIYSGVSMMIHKHFMLCPELPAQTRAHFNLLKKFAKKGEPESRSYWIEAAKMIGMYDSVGEAADIIRWDPIKAKMNTIKHNF